MWQFKTSYLIFFVIFATSLQLPNAAAAGMPSYSVVLTEIRSNIFDHNVVAQSDFLLLSQDARNVINATFRYKRTMKKFNMRIKVSFERPDKTRLEVLDLTTDTCELLTSKLGKHKFMQTILKEFAAQTTFPQKCPFVANHTYSLVNFPLKLPQFPLPNLKFIGVAFLLDENKKRKLSEIRGKGVTKRVG